MLKFWLPSLALLILGSVSVLSQDSIPRRIYNTTFIKDIPVPKIDGLIEDQAWELVEWSGDYIQWSPNENTDPSLQSKLKILYDEKNLFVAFRCYDDQPEEIVSRLSRRDGFDGDWVEINVASVGDKRTAYSFTVSVSGVIGDEFITNDNSWDNTWNPIWYAKTNIDSLGWTAEVRIPLSQIRFGNAEEQVWGIQSTRRFFRSEERSVWQRSPQNTPGWVSNFGELHGLKNLKPQRQVEIQPYLVSALNTYEGIQDNPFRSGRDLKFNLGLDGKIGITNDLTLDFTFNPDFGQVEADPSAIALDGFQIFFQERRPFFIENKNIFDFRYSSSRSGSTFGSNNLFYSRRIGRAPQGFPQLSQGDYFEMPRVSTILGAAKFSGKTEDGWSLGILESVTSPEFAKISNDGNVSKELVEPFSNYAVGRVQKDFNNNNTLIGGILTTVNRELGPNVQFLHKSAYTGGLDFMHQWKQRAYYLKANLILSQVNGSQEAILNSQRSITRLFQREETDYLEVKPDLESLAGNGGNVQVGKAFGNWRYETGFLWHSPELELNDIGFQIVADDYRHYGWASYRSTKALKKLRAYTINYSHSAAFDYGNNLNEVSMNLSTWINLNNNWWINGGAAIKPVQYSNFALRGGPKLRLPDEFNYRFGISSDARKKLRFSLNYFHKIGEDKAYDFKNFNAQLTYQPVDALKLTISPYYSQNYDQLQYVSIESFAGVSRYVNGTIEQATLGIPMRVELIMTPNLSLQYWGQPFISAGQYKDYKYISDALAVSFEDRFKYFRQDQVRVEDSFLLIDENLDGTRDYDFARADFSFAQWRSNLVLRWEYVPGSEFYFVWSQDGSNFNNAHQELIPGLRKSITDIQNIFLVKFTYRYLK